MNFTGGDTFNKALRCVKRNGRVLVCGATAGYDAWADLRFLIGAECRIIGTQGWDLEHQKALIGLVKDGRLHPPIDDQLGLANLYAALSIAVEVVPSFGSPRLTLTINTPKGPVTL